MKRFFSAFTCIMLGATLYWILSPPLKPASAALFWAQADNHLPLGEGVRGKFISVCFVGTATSTRLDRVQQIAAYIREFENVANITFLNLTGVPIHTALALDPSSLDCRPSTAPPGADDFYDGDIRVVIPNVGFPLGSGAVPGQGCPMQSQPNSSWSNAPWDLSANRSCLYNLRLGDDDMDLRTGLPNGEPWLNHTLHEFGHALGLGHEHARADENAQCVPPGHDEYHAVTAGYMTPYDKDSVMHYQFTPAETPSCVQTGSNYSDSGFTAYDRLALRILYPEDNRVAEFVGATVLPSGELLNLQSTWLAQGAYINVVASNFNWKIDDVTVSTGPTLSIDLPAGEYSLEFSYDDLLGRDYYYSGLVRVLEPEDFAAQVVAPISANLPLLYPNHVFIPTYDITIQPDQYMTVNLPGDLFGEPVIIDYAVQPPLDVPGRQHLGLFYEFTATNLADGQPAQILPGKTYDLTAAYSGDMLPPGTAETSLGFYFWDPQESPGAPHWQREASSVVDVSTDRVMANPHHFSFWTVLEEARQYLPFVEK